MMTGKELSIVTAHNGVAPQASHGGRPAILTLITQLFAPMDQVRSRLWAAQASLEKAVARLESGPLEE